MAKKKFDTNPLDPDFPEKAKAAAAETGPTAGEYTAPQQSPFRTSEYPTAPPSITEEETRKFEGARFDPYAYQPQPAPMVYHPSPFFDMNRAGDRKVAKTGVPEKWLVGLPYLPWVGLVAGLIQLLVIPKEENKVRFHAAQGFALHVAVLIIGTILRVVGEITNQGIGSFLFSLVITIMMIVWAIKAWKGKPVHIEILDDVTNWFEEKIGPIKSS
jgi:uncharacterized membrane protein